MGKIAATFNDPDYFPENVASIIEGGGPNSRLFLDIREKRGYAYDVHTEIAALADAGTFSAVTQVRNEVAADALQGILDHLDRMAKEPVERQELTEAKSYANGVFLLGMEPQRGLADKLVADEGHEPAEELSGDVHHEDQLGGAGSDRVGGEEIYGHRTTTRSWWSATRRRFRSRLRSSGRVRVSVEAQTTNENNIVEGSLQLRSVPGHRRRGGGPHRLEDQAQHRAPSRLGRDDGGG